MNTVNLPQSVVRYIGITSCVKLENQWLVGLEVNVGEGRVDERNVTIVIPSTDYAHCNRESKNASGLILQILNFFVGDTGYAVKISDGDGISLDGYFLSNASGQVICVNEETLQSGDNHRIYCQPGREDWALDTMLFSGTIFEFVKIGGVN